MVRFCFAQCFVCVESSLTEAPRTVFACRKPTFYFFALLLWTYQFHLMVIEFRNSLPFVFSQQPTSFRLGHCHRLLNFFYVLMN